MRLFNRIIDFLSVSAPMAVAINIVLGIVLLVIGIYLLVSTNKQTKRKRIAAMTCLTISALAFVGSASTWFISTFIF